MAVASVSGAGGRRQSRRAETRARLLAAARAAFIDGSVVSTPLDAIAAAASTSKATLFFHFRDRRGLLVELAREVYLELVAEAPRPVDAKSFLLWYLELQRDPRARLLWEVGDVLAADGVALSDVPYGHMRVALGRLLGAEAIPAARVPHLVAVIAPASFLLARRVALGQAHEGEVSAFVAHVDAVAHAGRVPAASGRPDASSS